MVSYFTFLSLSPGIDEDDAVPVEEAQPEEMPPLEGDDDDASRMEEVD